MWYFILELQCFIRLITGEKNDENQNLKDELTHIFALALKDYPSCDVQESAKKESARKSFTKIKNVL